MDSNNKTNLKHYKKSMIDEYAMKNQHSDSDDSRSNSQKQDKPYCVCKTTDTSRFMIACDKCDEWFHGDCVGVSESFSKKIKIFYCHVCRFEDKNLKIKYTKKYTESEIKEKFWKEIRAREAKEAELLKQQQQLKQTNFENFDISKLNSNAKYGKSEISGEDIENFVSAIAKLGADVGGNPLITPIEASSLLTHQKDESSMDSFPATKNSSNTKRRKLSDTFDIPYKTEDDLDDDIEKPRVKKRGRKKVNENVTNARQQTQKLRKPKQHSKYGNNQNEDDDEDKLNSSFGANTNEKQCLGPGCTNQALKPSKYCSDECGLQLAKNNRQKSQINSQADILNETQIKKISNEIELMRQELNLIEEKHIKLDRLIEHAKIERIDENCEIDKDYEETEMFCVTCGHTCSQKHALKHMEKCFNKYESQAFFGSYFKSSHEGRTVFCDFFNSQTKMYCKRLKVMCPEHKKEKKIEDEEVCGCPIANRDNLFEDSNKICLIAKKNCIIHFKWEKLRRAQLDLDKLRLWLKLDELYEQKRQLEIAVAYRNGFLSQMLHKTIES